MTRYDPAWMHSAAQQVQAAEREAITPQDRIRAAIRILQVADATAARVVAAQPPLEREQARLVVAIIHRAMGQLAEFA